MFYCDNTQTTLKKIGNISFNKRNDMVGDRSSIPLLLLLWDILDIDQSVGYGVNDQSGSGMDL